MRTREPDEIRARPADASAPAGARPWPGRRGALAALVLVAGMGVVALGAGRSGGARALPADRDGDGVADAGDACPAAPGLPPDGCPPRDRDGDGVLDRVDPCPDQAGPEGNRGCPDRDGDRDRVVDRRDLCPAQRGHADAAGCPLPDRDGDAIADGADACPDQAEVWNGRRDRDGCPDRGRALLDLQPAAPGPDAPGLARVMVLAPGRWFRSSGRLSSAGREAAAVIADALAAARALEARVEVTCAPGRSRRRPASGRSSESRASDAESRARARAEQLGRALAAALPGLRIELAPGRSGPERVHISFE